MGAARAWAISELRRRLGAAVAVVVLIGMSGAVVLTAATGAIRTATAFDRLLASSGTADVGIQYSAADPSDAVDDEVLAALEAEPRIAAAVPVYMTLGGIPDYEFDLGVMASPSPAFLDTIDRPKLVDGRMPALTSPSEVLVNEFLRDGLDLELGDTLRVHTFTPEALAEDRYDELDGPLLELTVVGVGTTPYDIVDTHPGIFATPAFHAATWGHAAGYGPMLEVRTDDARAPVALVEEALEGLTFDELEISPSRVDLEARVEDGTRVLSFGLTAFAITAGLSALVACGQALHRRMATAVPDQEALRSIGITRVQRSIALVLSVGPPIAVGALVAVLLAIAGSSVTPIGIARTAEPDPGIDVNVAALAVGGGVVIALLMLIALVSAWRLTGRHVTALGGDGRLPRAWSPVAAVRARLAPAPHLGVWMATESGRGRAAVPVRSALVGASLGVAGMVAVATFGSSLDALVSDPARSGWNWTLAPDVYEEQIPELVEIPGVRDVGIVMHRRVVVDGRQTLGMAVRTEKGDPSMTLLEGRMPVTDQEIALAPATAERAGVGVGDPVDVADSAGKERPMVVAGIVLVPTFDDNAFDNGAVVAPTVIDELARSDGFERAIVTFDPTISDVEAARRIERGLPGAMSAYATPSLPPDVEHLRGVRFLPRYLSVFLGALALGVVGHALATSVRRRRRELGIVRSLGFIGRQLRQAVTTQSATLAVVGLAAGVPLGVVGGRAAWGVVAERIGVAPAPQTSLLVLAALLVGGLLLSVAVAGLPAIAASRLRPTDALRSE